MSADELAGLRGILARQTPPTRPLPTSQSIVARGEPEDEPATFAFGRVGARPQMTLLIRQASGAVRGFPYAHFEGLEADDPDSGFTMMFAGTAVKVSGQQLERVLRYVCEHRVAEIRVCSRAAALAAPETAELVTAVEVGRSGKSGREV